MLHHQMLQTVTRLPKQHKILLASLATVLFIVLLLPSEDASASRNWQATQDSIEVNQRVALPLNIEKTESKNISEQPVSLPTEAVIELEKPLQQEEALEITSSNPDISEGVVDVTKVSVSTETIEFTPGTELASELVPGTRYELAFSEEFTNQAVDEVDLSEPDWQVMYIGRGDNLAKIFDKAGLTPQEVYHVSRAGKPAKKLTKMLPGKELRILKDENGAFAQLEYDISSSETLSVVKSEQGYRSTIDEKVIYSRLNYASGTITSNFWNAGTKAGLTDNQIMSLATIFGWDIDFALDIRQGDHFNVVFEENYIDGEFVGFGDIVAAEFTNQGEQFSAMRYTDGNYYTPEGRSMRKSFLRAPVNFKYISSNFKPRRFHPVLKRWKAHNGIDYAASSGTPVVAAGDGKVIEASYNKYNGNYVFIQHGDTYTTKYLHFTKRAVKKGQWVKQGQVIGYVGKTGLATAPHLHYEFLVNGKHKNPRTVNLPKALPIAKKEKERFLELAKNYQHQLDTNRRIMLAMN